MSDVAPALNMLLGIAPPRAFCDTCPFAELDGPFEQVRNDPTEAHYRCQLLERQVWGESPECTVDDWRERARGELEDLLSNVEAYHARRDLAAALKRRAEGDT